MAPPQRTPAPPATPIDGHSIGLKVQELRSQRGKTLDWLAEATGFTKGYLSRIENGKKTPPIGTLARIANAFEVDLTALLRVQAGNPGVKASAGASLNTLYSVVRAGGRSAVIRGASAFGYNYVSLTDFPERRQMEPFLFTFPKEIEKRVFFEHEGEEFLFIISGQVEWQIAHEKFILNPGDSVYIDSRVPHRGRAIGEEATAIVVVYSPHFPAQT